MTPPAPLRVVCAWCPDFNPRDPVNKGASHTICPACLATLGAELDAHDARGRARRDDDDQAA